MYSCLVAYIHTHTHKHTVTRRNKKRNIHFTFWATWTDIHRRALHLHTIFDMKGATVRCPAEGQSCSAGELVLTAATPPAVTSSQLDYAGWIHIWFMLIFWRIIHITLKMSQQRSKYSSLVSYLPLSTCHIHVPHKHTRLCMFLLINKK